MRVLCVAEKPSIARSVTQILSGGQFDSRNTQNKFIKNFDFTYPQTNAFFTVTSVSGHIMEHEFFPSHNKWYSCDPITLFDAPVDHRIKEDCKTIERNLRTEARRAEQLMIWTDCDREGENIGAEVATICRNANPRIVVTRARFSAIIPQQIHNAAQHPVSLDQAQADAVEARSVLDLRLGAAFTRMQSLALQNQISMLRDTKKVISYGPCQFPTLGFVVSRYEQVQAFSPEPFWYIHLTLPAPTVPGSQKPPDTEFTWKRGRLFDFDVSLALYEAALEDPLARVVKTTNKSTKKWKPLPLTTVELQKAGSRLLRLAPKKILDIAEKLYQQGFLSYPRTETDQFDPQFDFMNLINKQTVDPAWGAFANQLQNGGFTAPRNGKKNDKAHPPIHPTAHNANLAGDEKRVYEFIARRFLACCSKDAEGWETTVEIVSGGEEFNASGLVVLERNYLDVYPYDKWNGKVLPEFEEGQEIMPSVCTLQDGETTEPALLTEADLVGLMDKNGIGTDATIAQHIQTIIDREYVLERMEGSVKYLVPSTLGIGLVEGYDNIGFDKSLSKPLLRRDTERSMVEVCDRMKTKDAMLEESIEQYRQVYVRAKQEFDKVVTSVRNRIQHHGTGAPQSNSTNGPGHDGGNGGGGGNGNGPDDDSGGAGRGGGSGRPPRSTGGTRRNATNVPPQTTVARGRDVNPKPPSRSTAPINPPSVPIQRAAPMPPPTSTSAGVQCHCGVDAGERTVVKEGSNKGRRFWRCGKEGECDFFEWMDGPSSGPSASSSHSAPISGKVIPQKRPAAVPVQSTSSMPERSSSNSNKRLCKCEMTAVQKTVMKEGANQGRNFWGCPNSEKARCGFFEWDDDPGGAISSSSNPNNDGNRFAGRGNPAQGDSSATGDCFKCGQPGHWATACPNSGQAAPNRSRSFGSTAPSNVSTAACYKCGQEGHFSNACTNSGKSAPRSQGTTSGTCFKCGEAGHYSNACPNDGNSRSTSHSNSKSGRGRGGGRKASGTRGKAKAKSKSNFSAADDY